MLRANTLLALIAAIMLVIAGAPTRASANACDPCPPDCPMMQQMSTTMDHQSQAPDKGGKTENPCKSALVCQASTAAVAAPSETPTSIVLTAETVDHGLANALAAPSRPPDRTLRPPIQL